MPFGGKWLVDRLEQQERAREMSKCTKEYGEHDWGYSGIKNGYLTLMCCQCKRKVDIEIKRLINSGYAKVEEKTVKLEPTVMDRVAYLRSLKSPCNQIGDEFADISDRLDQLENHWLCKQPVTRE